MSRTWIDRLTETTENKRFFQQEKTILEVTELICELMDEQGISRTELAKKLGYTKGYISQLLDGTANMTLRTLSDVLFALGNELKARAVSLLRDEWVQDWNTIKFAKEEREISRCGSDLNNQAQMQQAPTKHLALAT